VGKKEGSSEKLTGLPIFLRSVLIAFPCSKLAGGVATPDLGETRTARRRGEESGEEGGDRVFQLPVELGVEGEVERGAGGWYL
jgi:hypothetical protein